MAPTARRLGALWEALCALPSNQVGEIVAGELFASPRPAGAHSRVASKLPVYALNGVAHAWLLEPVQRTLEVFEAQGASWRTLGTWEGDVKVKAAPFEAVELDLGSLWADIRRPTR